MRNLYKTLCAVLAAALLALTLLPAGVLAADTDLEIRAQNFPDANFRAWLTNPANLNGAGGGRYPVRRRTGGGDQTGSVRPEHCRSDRH